MVTSGFFARYRLLAETNRQLAAAGSIDAILDLLQTRARAIAGADGVAVIRRDGNFVDYVGEDAIAPLWSGQRFPIERCVSGLAILGGAPIFIPDIGNDARVPMSAYLATFVQSMAVFPLGAPAPVAALGFYWREVRPLGRDVEKPIGLLVQAADAAFERIGMSTERTSLAA